VQKVGHTAKRLVVKVEVDTPSAGKFKFSRLDDDVAEAMAQASARRSGRTDIPEIKRIQDDAEIIKRRYG
jgi:hypothetical protein